MRFLKDILHYLEAVHADEHNFKHLIREALRGPAKDWLDNIESRIDKRDTFIEFFINKYWNNAIRSKIRRELEFGFYREHNYSRSEYVLKL